MESDEQEKRKPSLAKLLKYGADPNSLSFEDSGERRTLLCLSIEEAVQIEDFSKIDLLLDAKADPCRASENGSFPLQLAVKHKHVHLSRQLLQRKADVNQQDTKLVSPLHTAAFSNDPKIVQLLLMHQANVNSVDRLGQPPLFFAASRQVVSQLVEAEADVMHLNSKGQSALHLAAHSGHFDTVAYLADNDLWHSMMINLQDVNGRTPLHHAAVRGHQDVVSRLMDVGADPYIETKRGQTAMSLADHGKHMDCAYYIYTRVTGSNRSTWRESLHNPVFLTTAAILGVACFVNRTILWEFTWDLAHIMVGK